LHISNAQLGLLSAAYFFGFGAMQIPLGIVMDKFGARRTETVLLLVALTGSLIFGYSDNLYGLMIGRFCIGVGVSACLMAAFTAYRRWFPIEQQGQLASGMLMFGTMGALMTTVPIQMSLPWLGWRGVFYVMAVMVAIAYLGIRFGLPKFDDHPSKNNSEEASSAPAFKFQHIIAHPYFLRLLPMGIINHGGFIALQTLWIGPWMIQVLGYSTETTAQLLFGFNFAMLVGYGFNAWFIPRANARGLKTLNYAKWLLMTGLVIQFFAITTTGPQSAFLWIFLALTATINILVQSSVVTVFPKWNAGVASTSYNLLIFIGAFTVQWGIGWGIDLAIALGEDKVSAFRQVFFTFLVLQICAYVWFLFYPKPLKKYLEEN
jgi:predicted MFS family arabinose efflux permease